ncbi:MAG: hypothetical protein CL691_04265 [Cellvibrionales bacterium]|nr:hypothetical protein [Cellvibrionales bacterium]|tara:strand:+ start:8214 stop:9254 length:1041 start_codon:yes stop_codon:yes gene_type:complete
MKILINSLAIGLCFALVSCQSSLDSAYQDYLQRLARIFESETIEAVAISHLSYPRPREWIEANVEAKERKTLGLLAFLSLDDCELRYVIARHNSALGKVASPSQRLHYQLDFLHHAPACIITLRAQGQMQTAAKLRAVMDEKKRRLAWYIWQGSLGEKEFRQFWQEGNHEDNYPANAGAALITALEQLNAWVSRWLSGDYATDIRAYEINLSVIRAGDGGALYRALSKQLLYLKQANTMFDNEALVQQRICPRGQLSEQAEILQNVVSKFWIQGLQRQSAALSRRHFALMPALQALEQQLVEGEPKAYSDWRKQRDTQFEQFLAAPKSHSLRINTVYQECDLTVGA